MGFDRQSWEPVLPKLRRRFRLVLVDNRGFGRSDRSAGSFGVADMAGDIIAVLDHAGIRKAHVMGASLGGLVAQELAITHPERVDGLVLACTAPGWPLAYPMPMASMRLITATAGLTADLGPSVFVEVLSEHDVIGDDEAIDPGPVEHTGLLEQRLPASRVGRRERRHAGRELNRGPRARARRRSSGRSLDHGYRLLGRLTKRRAVGE